MEENKPSFEIIPMEKKDSPPSQSESLWFHPFSAVCMIALDFTGSLGDITGFMFFLLMPLVILGIFCVMTLLVRWIQINIANDDPKIALKKGVIAGILCAIPTPIFGTAVGSYILLKSGLKSLKKN